MPPLLSSASVLPLCCVCLTFQLLLLLPLLQGKSRKTATFANAIQEEGDDGDDGRGRVAFSDDNSYDEAAAATKSRIAQLKKKKKLTEEEEEELMEKKSKLKVAGWLTSGALGDMDAGANGLPPPGLMRGPYADADAYETDREDRDRGSENGSQLGDSVSAQHHHSTVSSLATQT